MYNHACVCSCVGPIVDVKEQSDLFYRERYMANILALLTRPTCDFRDGRLITSSNFTQYLIELAFNDSYLFAMMHLIPADYTETLDCLSRSIAKHDVILPLAALFLLFSQVKAIHKTNII